VSESCGCSGEKSDIIDHHHHFDEENSFSKSVYKLFYKADNPYQDSFLNSLQSVESAEYMLDIAGNTLLIANEAGSNIFSKDGQNYIVAGSGRDNLFFSMCSTKQSDNQETTVIANFQQGQDHIVLFCTKRQISEEEVSISYDNENNATFIQIEDPKGLITIGMLGDYINLGVGSDIILNFQWSEMLDTKDQVCWFF
jgi:hypothetical protein